MEPTPEVGAEGTPAALGGGGATEAGRLDALADTLLAPLAPELYAYQREQRGHSPAEISEALATLARAVLRLAR